MFQTKPKRRNDDDVELNEPFNTQDKTSKQIHQHLSKMLDQHNPDQFLTVLKEMKHRGKHILVKFIEQYGSLLLLSAASKNFASCVKFLLEYKDSMNLDMRNTENGKNALLYATENDSYEISEMLLESGANCNVCDKDNATTMYNGCKNSNLQIIKLLIDQGFNFNKLFDNGLKSNGRTALIEICEKGDLHVLKYIINWLKNNAFMADFDIDEIDLYKETFGLFTANALHFACGNGHAHIARYLLQELNFLKRLDLINSQCKGSIDGQTGLYLASNVGSLETLKIFKEFGGNALDLNIQEKENGRSSLFIATLNNYPSCVEWFIQQPGCKVNIADKNGVTSLMIACEKGNHRCLKILCDCDRILITKDILNVAVKYGQTKSFQIVLNSLIERNKIETWDELMKSKILDRNMINDWIGKSINNNNSNENDEMLHFLNDLLRNVFDTNNFDLLLARLDYQNNNNDNTLEQQINIKYKKVLKMQKLVSDIEHHCDTNTLNSFVACINEMIVNKCAVDDTLMMLSAHCNYPLFCDALKTSIKDCISFGGSHVPNAKDIAWYEECILKSNIFSVEQESKNDNNNSYSPFRPRQKQEQEQQKQQQPSGNDVISVNQQTLLLYDEIKTEIMDKEIKKHEKYLENELNELQKQEKDYWNSLINYKSFNLDFFNNIQQHNITSRYDFRVNLMDDKHFNGIKPRYSQGNLINDYHTGFNGNFLYDNTGYCVDLLILAHKINNEFENDCKSLFDTIDVDCTFNTANVKKLQRSQMKASMEYYDSQFPRTSRILDFNRCCVSFKTCKDLISALNKVINIIGKGPNIEGFGCLRQIVRVKNTFNQFSDASSYVSGMRNNNMNNQYCDVKLNLIVQSKTEKKDKSGKNLKNNSIIGEIKLTLDFMLEINKTQHIFYNFMRNEQVYRNISNKLEFENSLYDKRILINKFEMLKQIIATQNYHQLSNQILFGNFNKIVGLNFLSIKQLIELCKENQWQKGEKLLNCCYNNRYGTQVKEKLLSISTLANSFT